MAVEFGNEAIETMARRVQDEPLRKRLPALVERSPFYRSQAELRNRGATR